MFIGETVVAKINGEIKEVIIVKMLENDLELLDGETIYIRKYWEVRNLSSFKRNDNEKI